MRNLKKFLALVLALMMTFSLMVTVNAASGDPVSDLETATSEFQEAIAVLNGLKIITGYEDGTFRPEKLISRQEATALVYRLHSGDAENTKNNLYSTVDNIAKFKDVDPKGGQQWSAGYIGYCANQEIIKGVGADRFNPTGNVTGYQMLAMVLRAIGYGQNGEYEGTGWQTRVATAATKLGMLTNIDDTNYAGTLSAPATRELVAEIVFQAALLPTVTYTPAFGYQEYGDDSLGVQNFNLNVRGWQVIDDWGNPGYKWYKGSTAIATIEAEPDMEFTDTKRECDIAHELEIDDQQDFVLYLNDEAPITSNYRIVATDTTTKVGGQGRLTKVYDTLEHPHYDLLDEGEYYRWKSTVTMVDTFLAKVTGVTTAKLDGNNHIITPATLTLAVYDQPQTTAKTPRPSTTVVSKKSDDATNWEYNVGDMILLNAYTDHDEGYDAAGVRSDHGAADTEADKNKAAFETEAVPAARVSGTNAVVLGKADSKVAKQTTVYWNQEKHNVDGTDIPDQIDLFLDVAGTTTNSDYTWYFDQYNNIIGIGEAVQSNYGVITSIYSSFNTADGATNGEAVARAHVKYADGSEGDVTIAQFVVYSLWSNASGGTAGHAAPIANYGMGTTARAVELVPVYDFSGVTGGGSVSGDAMTASAFPAGTTYTPVNPVGPAAYGKLNVSPVASINATVENGSNTDPYYGIIKGNLFKFITAGNGEVSAIEVAGTNLSTDRRPNDAFYANNNHGLLRTDTSGGDAADVAARTLYKNGGYLAVTTPATTIRLDNNTQIMVLNDDTKDITTYNGLSALSGNIICESGSEVDWTDYDGDGIAEVVYVVGEAAGSVAYGLFYYNGGAGQWNDTDKKGTLAGYLGGEAKTLTFTDRAEYDLVRGSNAYGGHLFGVRLNGDEVTNLMGRDQANYDRFELLVADAAVGTTYAPNTTALNLGNDVKLSTGITSGAPASLGATTFVTGVQGGNGYTTNTRAVWVSDTGANVTWDEYRDEISVAGNGTYSLTGTSKIVGDLAYLNVAGRANDVTIVYENNAVKSIVEIYVTTMPDNTTPGGVVDATGVGDDVNTIPDTITNPDDFSNALRNNPNTGVWFWNTSTVNGPGSNQHGNRLLYFPFNSHGVADKNATLEIFDSNGDIVYREVVKTQVGVTATNWIVIEYIVSGGNTSTGHWFTTYEGLKAGTYTYTIAVDGVYETGGSFTLV